MQEIDLVVGSRKSTFQFDAGRLIGMDNSSNRAFGGGGDAGLGVERPNVRPSDRWEWMFVTSIDSGSQS